MPVVNLYPKGGKQAKKVEIPVAAVRKSLPKRRETGEKGRDSCSRHPEISTQKAEIPEIGRESRNRRSEISTQIAEIPEKG